jgi:hypothetical protein
MVAPYIYDISHLRVNLKIHDNNAAMDEIKLVCLAYTHKVTSLYSGQDISSVMYFATKKRKKTQK